MPMGARLWAVLGACSIVAAAAQSFAVKPSSAPQGSTIRLHAPESARQARMVEKTVPLYAEADGTRTGLMPVPAVQKPGAYPLEFLDETGRALERVTVTVLNAKFPKQNIVLSRTLEELRPGPGELDAVGEFRQTQSDQRLWGEPFAAPVAGCRTSPFGAQRYHNGKPTGNFHGGVDQRTPAGEPVHAIADGTVRLAGMFELHGGTVGIDHGQGLLSVYLHQSSLAVKPGMAIHKGDVLGYAGSTGRSTAPHLHWAVYVNGVAVNPQQWVKLKACPAPKKARRHKAKAQ
jgi:murein DD-endopeptidase MepM/ murein hydrolase activator NlpD